MVTKKDIYKLFIHSGLKKGDSIFCHSDLTPLIKKINFPKNELCDTILNFILKILGEKGTLAVPVFSYSLAKKKIFNPNKIKPVTGVFSKFILNHPRSKIYRDPNLAVAIIGKYNNFLSAKPTINAYGKNSFFDRFYKINGKICNINLNIVSTFIHYFEKKLNVPYRFDKNFTGVLINNKKKKKIKSILYVRYLKESTVQNLSKLLRKSKKKVKVSKVKNIYTNYISLNDYFKIIQSNLKKDQNFLIKGYVKKNNLL